MQPQLNPYNESTFREKFECTDICKQLKQDFPILVYNRDCENFAGGTPRQHLGDPSLLIPKFFVSSFYYLNFLLVKQPTSIYDLGCGWNIFKRYIPNIIGIGAEDPNSEWFFADIHDYVDQDFVAGHQEAFESVFSICALHFRPISEIRQIVLEFISMVRPGGRGYLAMNLQRLLELDDAFLKEHGTDLTKIEQYVRSKLNELPVNLLCFDVYRIDIDAGFNGNIHIVFEKP